MRLEQKLVIVRRATRLEGLKKRHATVAQAEFLMELAGEQESLRRGTFRAAKLKAEERPIYDYKKEDQTYTDAIARLRKDLNGILPIQLLDREMLPNYLFGPADIVVTVGQDGLVANTAKYALGLPIVAVNPDPMRFDGILLPFQVNQARSAVLRAREGTAKLRRVTLAEVVLSDKQRLLGFNDLFIGCRTHVSARYKIEYNRQSEPHSSSGVLVSTGAGSTGWLSSVFNMAAGISALNRPERSALQPIRMKWEDPRLIFVVREPFVSKSSSAGIVCGTIAPKQELILESQMPQGGVIFSDGIESDFLEFNSGTIARIRAADQHATLVV